MEGTTQGVYALETDGTGGLWIGTAGAGLVQRSADGTTRHLTQANTGGRLASDSVRVLARAHDGALLAGTDAGLVRVDRGVCAVVPMTGETSPSRSARCWPMRAAPGSAARGRA